MLSAVIYLSPCLNMWQTCTGKCSFFYFHNKLKWLRLPLLKQLAVIWWLLIVMTESNCFFVYLCEQTKVRIKIFRNIYSDETVGRVMLIYLAQYLLDNYGVLPEITNLVDSTDIFLMPTMNPDGYNRSKVRINSKYIMRPHKLKMFVFGW